MFEQKIHILDVPPAELVAQLKALDMPHFRVEQIQEWIFKKRATSFDQMTNISLYQRKLLDEKYALFTSQVVGQHTAEDGTRKILLRWPGTGAKEGGLTEAVMIPCDSDRCDDFGNTVIAQRRTACLSTQVGCPVGCAFCASGLEGLQRNLTAGEIIEEALRLTHLLPVENRLSNVVFMGMGEPLANFDATLIAIAALMAPWGLHISGRKITVSTVGLPPQMKRLADRGLPLTLAISLHAPNDALRRQIIPWAGKIPMDQIIDAGRYYFTKTGREVTLEYILLDGVNTLPDHARELAAVAKQLRANVNLIFYNEVPELPFKRPTSQTALRFETLLRAAHVNTHIRKSRGREIAAACGQLARQDKHKQREQLVTLGTPTTPA